MARTNWTIYVQTSGPTWTSDGTIYAPNDDLDLEKISTQQKLQLADGSNGFVTPETKTLKLPLSFVWSRVEASFVSKISTYMDNHDYLKIVDDNADEYIGRFTDLRQIWLTGVDESTDGYDIEATFERME